MRRFFLYQLLFRNKIGDTTMTLIPAASNGQHPVPPEVTLRKPTDLPTVTTRFPTVPKSDLAWSLATGTPIPRDWLAQVDAMAREQQRIGHTREPDCLSNMEAFVASKGMAGAEQAREQGADALAGLVDQAAVLIGEQTVLRTELDRLDTVPIAGPNDEITAVKDARERMNSVSTTVTSERDDGSVKHRRVPRTLRKVAIAASVVDFPILLHFTTQVFNVDLTGLATGDGTAWSGSLVPLLTSIVFAVLGTLAVAVGLSFFGRDLKGYKDADGHLDVPDGQARTIPLLFAGLSVALTGGAGFLMAYRIVSESLAAGGGTAGAVMLGVFFAIVVVAVNAVVFFVHYRDGSLQTDEISHLAAVLGPIEEQRVATARRIDTIGPELVRIQLQAERVYGRTLTMMGEPVKGADQLRLLARAYHQGCGAEATIRTHSGSPHANLIAPSTTVDHSILDELMNKLDELVTSSAGKSGAKKFAALNSLAIGSDDPEDDDTTELDGEW